jgi:hypothetical protein
MTNVVKVGLVRVIIKPIFDINKTHGNLERMVIRYIGGEEGVDGDTFEHELIIRFNTKEELERVSESFISDYREQYNKHNPVFKIIYREPVVAHDEY